MSSCPTCGAEVREGKAFCYNCGAPMTPSTAGRGDKPSPDLFKSTVIVPPSQNPRPSPPPPQRSTTAPPERRRPAPETFAGRGAGRGARRKFFYGKFGLGVVALLLLVLLGLFALALLLN